MHPPMMMVETTKGEQAAGATVGPQPKTTPTRKQSVFGNAPTLCGSHVVRPNNKRVPVICRNSAHVTPKKTHSPAHNDLHGNPECISIGSQGSQESQDSLDEPLREKRSSETGSSDGELRGLRDSDTTASQDSDALDELEDMVLTLQTQLNCYRARREELDSFEQSYKDSKRMVREMAQELVMKIREHEVRLTEEIETRRETTHKQLGWGKDKLDKQVKVLEKLCDEGTQAIRAALNNDELGSSHSLNQHQSEVADNLRHAFESEEFFLNNVDIKLTPISINPVRCNTAFATMVGATDSVTVSNQAGHRRKSCVALNTSIGQPSRVRTGSLQVSPSCGFNIHRLGASGELSRRFSLQATPGYMRMSPSLQHRLRSPCLSEDVAEPSIGLLWQITTEGPEPGQINCPNDIMFLPSGELVVSDRDNHRLQVFSKLGHLHTIIGEGKINPRRITATSEGHIAVTDSKDNVVKVFDLAGNLQSTWGRKRFKTLFKSPCGIATNSHKQFIVSDMEKHIVTIHSSEGKLIRQLTGENGRGVEFHSPSYVTVNEQDNILVSDNWNHCVKVFDEHGQFMFEFEQQENADTGLTYPNGITCDTGGNMYVADWGSHSVSQFTHDGQFRDRVLTRKVHSIYHPAGLAIHGSIMAVSEYSDSHSAIRVFDLDAQQ